jgi:hypothetical protein
MVTLRYDERKDGGGAGGDGFRYSRGNYDQ